MHSGILDNHYRGKVGEYLKEEIKTGSDLSIVSAYFTIFAFDKLKDQLQHIDHLRFLFGEPTFPATHKARIRDIAEKGKYNIICKKRIFLIADIFYP